MTRGAGVCVTTPRSTPFLVFALVVGALLVGLAAGHLTERWSGACGT